MQELSKALLREQAAMATLRRRSKLLPSLLAPTHPPTPNQPGPPPPVGSPTWQSCSDSWVGM